MGIYIVYLTTYRRQKLNLFHKIDQGAYFQTLETGVILSHSVYWNSQSEFSCRVTSLNLAYLESGPTSTDTKKIEQCIFIRENYSSLKKGLGEMETEAR